MCVVELGLWRDDIQTKRNHHHPLCENGAYALGLGVLMQHTMVGAKVARHHGCGKKRQQFIRKQVFWTWYECTQDTVQFPARK